MLHVDLDLCIALCYIYVLLFGKEAIRELRSKTTK